MLSNSIGGDYFDYDEDDIEYQPTADIIAINKLIEDLEEPTIKEII